jgi:hypothetical protein
MATLAFLQIDALVPLPGASDVKEGFTRVPLMLCPAFSAQARASHDTFTRREAPARRSNVAIAACTASCRAMPCFARAKPPLQC